MIEEPKTILDLSSGRLSGEEVISSKKRIGDLEGIFQDEQARLAFDQEMIVYEVQVYKPVKEGTPGGLFFGNTTIKAGKVGDEYFMTRGHYHSNLDTAEYYWCIFGKGVLILMDSRCRVWSKVMRPGSLHYIPGKVAHRVVNSGDQNLVFNACWPSDAGHNYVGIEKHGFKARLLEMSGKPELICQ